MRPSFDKILENKRYKTFHRILESVKKKIVDIRRTFFGSNKLSDVQFIAKKKTES